MRGRVRTWTDEQFRDAVAGSTNLTDVIRALGLRAAPSQVIVWQAAAFTTNSAGSFSGPVWLGP